jgi:hypothetical protein
MSETLRDRSGFCRKLDFNVVKRLRAIEFVEVDGADQRYLRIDDTLTDEHGDDVKLKKGAHVEVTVTADPKT